jgi:phage terminase small subunit
MKSLPEMPADLDREGKKKYLELIGSVDIDADLEMLANYCRQHSNLLTLRGERTQRQKSGRFETMVKGRDGTMVLNPLITAENRMVASLNRMLEGLATSRKETSAKRPLPSTPRPPGFMGDEPPGGWALEAALCGYRFNEQTNNWDLSLVPARFSDQDFLPLQPAGRPY